MFAPSDLKLYAEQAQQRLPGQVRSIEERLLCLEEEVRRLKKRLRRKRKRKASR